MLNLLTTGFVDHQHCVWHFNHYQVSHADQAHQSACGLYQRVMSVSKQYITHLGIALQIFGQHTPDSIPSA